MLKYFLVRNNRTWFGFRVWWNSFGWWSRIIGKNAEMKALLKPVKRFPTIPFSGGPRISATSKEGLAESSKAFDALAEAKFQEKP